MQDGSLRPRARKFVRRNLRAASSLSVASRSASRAGLSQRRREMRGKAHRDPGLVARRALDAFKGDLQHEAEIHRRLDRPHRPEPVYRVVAHEFVELFQLVIREAEIGLAHRHQRAFIGPRPRTCSRNSNSTVCRGRAGHTSAPTSIVFCIGSFFHLNHGPFGRPGPSTLSHRLIIRASMIDTAPIFAAPPPDHLPVPEKKNTRQRATIEPRGSSSREPTAPTASGAGRDVLRTHILSVPSAKVVARGGSADGFAKTLPLKPYAVR